MWEVMTDERAFVPESELMPLNMTCTCITVCVSVCVCSSMPTPDNTVMLISNT